MMLARATKYFDYLLNLMHLTPSRPPDLHGSYFPPFQQAGVNMVTRLSYVSYFPAIRIFPDQYCTISWFSELVSNVTSKLYVDRVDPRLSLTANFVISSIMTVLMPVYGSLPWLLGTSFFARGTAYMTACFAWAIT